VLRPVTSGKDKKEKISGYGLPQGRVEKKRHRSHRIAAYLNTGQEIRGKENRIGSETNKKKLLLSGDAYPVTSDREDSKKKRDKRREELQLVPRVGGEREAE